MKTFSIMEAAGEPFRLVGRRPLATLAWGLVMMVPVAGSFALMIPMFAKMAAMGAFDPATAGDPAVFGDDFAAMMQFQAWSGLLNIAQALAMLVVTTAIIRAVFADRRGDRAAFLRLGMDELRVAVVGVAIGIGAYALLIVVALLAVAIGFALWSTPDPWRVISYVGLGLAVFFGFLLLWGRLALLAPATIHHGDFAFAEGWAMGKGQGWRLFGLLIVLCLISFVLGLALVVVVMVVIGIAGGFSLMGDPNAVADWFRSLPDRPGLLLSAGAVLLLPMAYLHGFSQALMTAPFAHVVRQLATPRERVEALISTDTEATPE